MSGLRRIASAVAWRRDGIDAIREFHCWSYLRHNQRRQEHLASLGLQLAGRSVLEVGAGIGDHTSFFLDRGCTVVTTEARAENLEVLRARYPMLDVRRLDLDDPDPAGAGEAEIVYCYGTLYHLARPAEAIAFLAERTSSLMLLETCVSPGYDERINRVDELRDVPSQAISGSGNRPTRPWLRARLGEHFPHVYLTKTQPWHEEFPLEWDFEADPRKLTRAVFVASREALANPSLTETIPLHHTHH